VSANLVLRSNLVLSNVCVAGFETFLDGGLRVGVDLRQPSNGIPSLSATTRGPVYGATAPGRRLLLPFICGAKAIGLLACRFQNSLGCFIIQPSLAPFLNSCLARSIVELLRVAVVTFQALFNVAMN
jgi:hypothetical protein